MSVVHHESNENVVGTDENQIDPADIVIYTEDWQETDFAFERLCLADYYETSFFVERPNPKYLTPDYKVVFYVKLGDDVDTLVLTFGEKVQRQSMEVDPHVFDYYPTVFAYNSYSVSELDADVSECAASFVLYK